MLSFPRVTLSCSSRRVLNMLFDRVVGARVGVISSVNCSALAACPVTSGWQRLASRRNADWASRKVRPSRVTIQYRSALIQRLKRPPQIGCKQKPANAEQALVESFFPSAALLKFAKLFLYNALSDLGPKQTMVRI